MKINALTLAVIFCSWLSAGSLLTPIKKKPAEPSALDKYVQSAMSEGSTSGTPSSPGSIWNQSSRLTDLSTDIRASQVNDVVTIMVNEQASAVATGDVNTSRVSTAASSITSLVGPKSATGALSNLLNSSTNLALKGTGETSRGVQLTTNLTARVTQVLPNGYLVVEGTKEVQVNSEHQTVTVRGVIRPADLSGNVITSDQVADLEIKVDGKGVINDAVRRPNLLYRILLGILPF